MISMKDTNRQSNEWYLKEAITIGDRPEIVARLRYIDYPLPVEIVQALADYLDPDRPAMKTGRKPRPYKTWAFEQACMLYYEYGCRDLEAQRLFMNFDKEEFQLVDGSDLSDDKGHFAPVWKHPHLERERNKTPLPGKGEIRDRICQEMGISARTFDKILAKHNRERDERIKKGYRDLVTEKGLSPDEAKQRLCAWHRMELSGIDQIIARSR